jgi:hypothetical protein
MRRQEKGNMQKSKYKVGIIKEIVASNQKNNPNNQLRKKEESKFERDFEMREESKKQLRKKEEFKGDLDDEDDLSESELEKLVRENREESSVGNSSTNSLKRMIRDHIMDKSIPPPKNSRNIRRHFIPPTYL